jgi:uncharacterized protein YerC
MRVSERKLNPSLKKGLLRTFSQTLVDLKTPQEAETFLADFLNENELETFTKRLAVAYWLKKGRSYANIRENLKVSSATIATIEKLLKKTGFQLALKNLEAEEWANVWAEKIKKFVKR